MKFEHALLAVDLSKSSDDLVHCMGDLKKLGISKVTLLTAVSNPYPGGPEKFDTSSFEKKLEGYAQKLNKQGFDADWKLEIQSSIYAPVTILQVAEELSADLLIVGHRGHNRLSELLLGSVASEIIQRSARPVLLLRVSDSEDDTNISICKNLTSHILAPTDFSENADRALLVFGNGQLKASNVTLLHVQNASDAAKEKELNKRKDWLTEKGIETVEATAVVSSHRPWKKITEYADQKDASMIVMGSQGKGYVEDLFIGSNSHRVARRTTKPLLLIPADQ
ncbi:universal stress protein [Fodinibius sp.]|uniref:universal stress protein n=1 Tax=Fodinibius sp. TaxID=1872440 RepID=UPI002ACEA344|nr:universal stress protein [Fodinibius sp.]MDZ7659365.1 universal stress protein [Fodinibius sp.]